MDLVSEAAPPPVPDDHQVLADGLPGQGRRVAAAWPWAMTRDAGMADDLVQEAFIRTLRARGAPEDPDELFAYLVRVVLNLTRSHAAKAARRSARRDPYRVEGAADSADDVGEAGRPGPLADAVAGLPRRQREVVFLRFWLDLSVDQTALAMGISPGAVKTHSSRAMDTLRDHLLEDDDER